MSINGKDLRENFNESEIIAGDISELYEENEKIDLKFLRILPNNKTQTFNIKTTNVYHDYNQPNIDFYVNNIDVNEKKGTIDVSFAGEFWNDYNEAWRINKFAHELLVFDRQDGTLPSNEDYINKNINATQCFFTDERWKKLSTVDPNRGLVFANIVSEKLSDKKSYYYVSANYDQETSKIDELDKVLYVEYFINSMVTLKNPFNLKNFPFDKQRIEIFLYQQEKDIDVWKSSVTDFTLKQAEDFKKLNTIQGWNITDFDMSYKMYNHPYYGEEYDGFSLKYDIERKSGYYIFKIIIPIFLILCVCWSACWIDPKEIESRLTVTIVCLLSLIAYNFVIDSDLPKLEYLTIMDYIILVSYIYATIPNFLSIYSFKLIKTNKQLADKYEAYERLYGLPSYLLIIISIILFNVNSSPEHTSTMFSWALMQ